MSSLWMIAASFLFACMGVCVKLMAEAGFSAAEIVFYRSLFALIILSPLLPLRGVSLTTRNWRFQMGRSLAGFFAMTFNFWAIALLPLSTAMTLNYTSSLFLVPVLMLLAGLRPPVSAAFVLSAGFAGVALILHPEFSGEQWFGASVGLLSGLIAAFSYYNIRELGALREPELRTVFYLSLTSTLLSLFWFLFSELHPITLANILPLIGVGGFATLAQICMTRAYGRGKALVCASLAYSAVIFATLFGIWLWQDHVSAPEVAGIALVILSGIAAGHISRSGGKKPERS
ncbi:MAG: DMT family transporter [Zoogloeaceae bacterium]|jgi:S-adenosylmethionine uptake transporter|nr:DMT family transporter [Zoogloeaceae bacterium]